jgi:hypothetical protein
MELLYLRQNICDDKMMMKKYILLYQELEGPCHVSTSHLDEAFLLAIANIPRCITTNAKSDYQIVASCCVVYGSLKSEPSAAMV